MTHTAIERSKMSGSNSTDLKKNRCCRRQGRPVELQSKTWIISTEYTDQMGHHTLMLAPLAVIGLVWLLISREARFPTVWWISRSTFFLHWRPSVYGSRLDRNICGRTRDLSTRALQLLNFRCSCCLAFALIFERASVGSQTGVTAATRRRILRRVEYQRTRFSGARYLVWIFVNQNRRLAGSRPLRWFRRWFKR